ncbi:hypothetical protein AK812_SmicGene16413 [Symbiodinium microadriaticum]|uniref:Ubiquitin-like domain-containing protein n=1 Tax=Symbiodinium microadriaticum TaxID=2951 RepID=A0A1Q9E0G2_SYMMI|nr:hypothetical protein AK812_SmicGene16413 [Symbiodinium microadriaticum]
MRVEGFIQDLQVKARNSSLSSRDEFAGSHGTQHGTMEHPLLAGGPAMVRGPLMHPGTAGIESATKMQESHAPVQDIEVLVALLSGEVISVCASASDTVNKLRLKAQRELEVGIAGLVAPNGELLRGLDTLGQCNLRSGDMVYATIRPATLASTRQSMAFALMRTDGSVVTWGPSDRGGDSNDGCSPAKLELFRERFPMDERAFQYLCSATPEMQREVLASFSPKNMDETDFSRQLTGFLNRSVRYGEAVGTPPHLAEVRPIAVEFYCGFEKDRHRRIDWRSVPDIREVGSQRRGGNRARSGNRAASTGGVLDADAPIKRARLQTGDSLVLQIGRVQVQATHGAFAAVLGDGSFMTWGDPTESGDSSDVRDQLKNVQHIQATEWAFAAIIADGSVVSWGNAGHGGDSSAVQNQLKNVQQLQAARNHVSGAFAAILDRNHVSGAFAAILDDGSVVTWGHAAGGGDSRDVQDELKNVQQIQATGYAFAAILADGSFKPLAVLLLPFLPLDLSSKPPEAMLEDELKNVQQIQATGYAFAAILADGSVVTWGDPAAGGDNSAVQNQLKNVQQVQATSRAFAAILGDGCGYEDPGRSTGLAHRSRYGGNGREGRLEEFRAQYPMDDRAFDYLLQADREVQDTVLAEFQPKRRHLDGDYSASVTSYTKAVKNRALSAPLNDAGYAQPDAGLSSGEQAMLDGFRRRYPMDDRAFQFLCIAEPAVKQKVMESFRPKFEGEADYSGLITSFIKSCKR